MAPGTRAGDVGREPKLRNSCDACAAAKIRCTQEKPECAYCVKRLKVCVYGLSKRVRRTPRAHTRGGSCHAGAPSAATTASATGINAAAAACQRSGPATPQLDQDWPGFMATLMSPGITTSSTDPSLTAEWASLSTSIDSFPHLDDPAFSFPTPIDQTALIDGCPTVERGIQTEDAPATTTTNTFNSSFTRSNRSQPTDIPFFPTGLQTGAGVASPIPPGHPSSLRPSPDHCTNTSTTTPSVCQYHCFVRILRSLAQLSMDSAQAGTAMGNGDASSAHPSFDQVQNQVEAMSDDTDRVLQCSCSKRSETIILLSLVIFKILAWYAAVVNAVTRGDSEPEAPNSANAGAARSCSKLVLPSMWTDLDGDESEDEDQRRIFIQHILSRLTGLQILISRLSQRLGSVELEACTTVPPRPATQGHFNSILEDNVTILPFSNSTLCALSSDLRARLCGMSRAIMEKLRAV